MPQPRNIKKDAALEGMHETAEEKSNQARGHKANLNNPSESYESCVQCHTANLPQDTSDKSKQHSKQALKDLGGEDAFYSKTDKK